jgi:hypothetical protein
MKLFSIGQAFSTERQQQRQSNDLQNEADSFELASDGGYLTLLKGVLFALFAYYNARLFIVTVPGWEGYMTAFCALAGEATALYCINNYTRSAGVHRAGLGLFGVLLTVFSITHASISFFRMESGATSDRVRFYCENVAFPLLFSLLLLASIIIPLLHWRKMIATEQAKAAVKIASGRAHLLAESAAMRDENALERERLGQLEEQIKLESEYIGKLQQFVQLKEREKAVIESITDSGLRQQVEASMGINSSPTTAQRRLEQLSPTLRPSWTATPPKTSQSAQSGNGDNRPN